MRHIHLHYTDEELAILERVKDRLIKSEGVRISWEKFFLKLAKGK